MMVRPAGLLSQAYCRFSRDAISGTVEIAGGGAQKRREAGFGR